MNPLEELKARIAQFGGECWIEELLVRGGPEGLKAAHVVIGYRVPGVLDGFKTDTWGPWPIDVVNNDPVWAQVCAGINQQAINTITVLQAQIEALQNPVEETPE